MTLRLSQGFEKINRSQTGWLLVVFLVGSLSSLVLQRVFLDQPAEQSSSEYRENGYQFISPLLECEHFVNQKDASLKDINKQIKLIAAEHAEQHISVYYRDLMTGAWYGHNESEPFSPQSLLKIPVVIALLKIEEEQPGTLQREIPYESEIVSNLPQDQTLQLGQRYSAQELLERTVILSDNVAFNQLVEKIPTQFLEKVHKDLNLVFPSQATPNDFISVRSYSTIFRVLYNSSYLSRSNSEYLLNILSQSTFSEGLRGGLPADIVVAHKFGIKNAQGGSESQLHDCGVVYHLDRPYVLCIMTRGNDIEQQKGTIQEISRTIYSIL